ncbi:carbonyl reductase [NADPH] 1-like [Cylas formicarius]|uniref:carbonyl reductase [NADPH] 1-like n=1 Tax=Cylas formicarius TaxID=197179 RepID=UPI00295849FC|nr:carbonyl reductase [NADPH] 1-like [Cylas formicarius]
MQTRKVAVVTGSNKGIGYAIVKGLCENFFGDVYLTARDVSRGQRAVENLKHIGFLPLFHQLDIVSETSVKDLKDYIEKEHGGIDLLINNASVGTSGSAEDIIQINYFGTLRVCNALFPLLRDNAKVINISSSAGRLQRIPSTELRAKFKDPKLNVASLNELMKTYLNDVKENKAVEKGWGDSPYVVSKVGINALTILHQHVFDLEKPYRNISITSVHPGYVKTDMNKKGTLTTEEGAKAALYLALQAEFKGKYVWFDCQVIDWDGVLPESK